MSRTTFPRLSQQKMANFLLIKRERLSWATREGIVSRDKDDLYRPEVVTPEWLAYERARSAKKNKRSEFEKQRARLTSAKAAEVERRLAIADGSLLSTDDIIETTKTVCLRIKSKLQAAIPRIARGCYHAPNVTEALFKARDEFDLLISELSALEGGARPTQFEVVNDAGGNGSERSATDEGPGSGVS